MLETRQLGLVLGILMLLSLAGPMILAILLAIGKITLFVGLVGAALLGIVVFLATQNFLALWKSSYWTASQKTPTIVGKTFSSALAYSTLIVFMGYLFQVLTGG